MTVTASNFERKANDLYETEPWATEALLRQFPVAGLRVWEPAAGNHAIVRVLRNHGAIVSSSDIETYDVEHDAIRDFLNRPYTGPQFDAIITNPPYGKGNRDAVRFAELALERCPGMVALLLTAKFDFGKTRRHLFADNPRFMAKIALLDRISWGGNGQTGTEDHAWYVWGPGPYEHGITLYEGRAA
jgi:Predicted DNA modification methylase